MLPSNGGAVLGPPWGLPPPRDNSKWTISATTAWQGFRGLEDDGVVTPLQGQEPRPAGAPTQGGQQGVTPT